MKVEKPIFVVGTGRSGTTMLQDILSRHHAVAWLPKEVSDRFPHRLTLIRALMEALDYPVAGRLLRQRLNPGECYGFWEYYCKGFSTPCRDLLAADVTQKNRERLQYALERVLTQKRARLLVKVTGWPRVGFLSEVFPNARFVHILRDGRAVASSLMSVPWWWGWRGPENWRWGPLSPEDRADWERSDRSFVVLAGIQWKILVDAMEKAKEQAAGDGFLDLRYEDICADPISAFKHIVKFCDLEWTPGFEKELRAFSVRNTNAKFREELTTRQQRNLEEVLRDPLRRYGYL